MIMHFTELALISMMAVLPCVALSDFVREDPSLYWNFAELSQKPAFRTSPYAESDYAGMKALLVKGRGPKDTSAEFFCYYGVPDGKKPTAGWPGVVLVHGGGGTAFPNAVAEWQKLGFAVIAPDWYNRRPAPALTNVPPSEVTVPRVDLDGGKRQDHVANVANMVLAHSLLRSFPEVDGNRTVFVGLSWGSWYGACVAAVDPRFRGCVEIYCGDRNARDPKTPMGFVNGRFLHAAKAPMWWAVSTNDRNVTPDSSNAGFEECARFDGCALVNDLPHSHIGFSFGSVHRMARYYVGLERSRLPKLGDAVVRDGVISAPILDVGAGIGFARLSYTTSDEQPTYKRKWISADAAVENGCVKARLPADTVQCYLAAYERDSRFHDLCGTTKFVTPNGKGQKND